LKKIQKHEKLYYFSSTFSCIFGKLTQLIKKYNWADLANDAEAEKIRKSDKYVSLGQCKE